MQGRNDWLQEKKKGGREVASLCLQTVQLQCCRWKLESETVRKQVFLLYYVVGFVGFFSVSLLKDLVKVLLFLCGTAQLVCTWLKESHGTLYLNICAFPSPFNSASWLLHSLGPDGDSLTSLTHDKYAPAVSPHVLIQEYKDGVATCLH